MCFQPALHAVVRHGSVYKYYSIFLVFTPSVPIFPQALGGLSTGSLLLDCSAMCVCINGAASEVKKGAVL